jgi:hypothetical protein
VVLRRQLHSPLLAAQNVHHWRFAVRLDALAGCSLRTLRAACALAERCGCAVRASLSCKPGRTEQRRRYQDADHHLERGAERRPREVVRCEAGTL